MLRRHSVEPQMQDVLVQLGPRSYPIRIGSNWITDIGAFARAVAPTSELALIVTDENVDPHAPAVAEALKSAGFRTSTVILQPGEETKSLRCEYTIERSAKRGFEPILNSSERAFLVLQLFRQASDEVGLGRNRLNRHLGKDSL